MIQNYQQVILHDLENFFFFLIKIAVTDQIKILDRKIKQNETQYDLDRNADKYLHCLLENWIEMNV